MNPESSLDLVRASGSYRDPEGFVFFQDNRVFRALTKDGLASYHDFRQSSLCQRLEEEDWITRTWEIDDAASAGAIAAQFPEVTGIIEQSRIPFISYPYEWSFDMLKDAALHTLDLLLHSGHYGFTLKDATTYNVQFLGCRPIFIDILSIAKYVPGTPWAGYTQFCQQFLFPLALTAHRGVHFQHFLRSYLEGIPLHVMKPLLGGLGWRKAGMFKHVILQSFFQTGFQADNPALKSSFQTLKFSLDHVTSLIRAMKKVVTQLSSSGPESHWAGYSENRSYTAPEIEAKQRFVEKHLQDIQPNSVWDLGCNTGEFSLIARKYADLVIAADADPESVNRLYRYCRENRISGILPLVLDVTNPSPGLGWNNVERQGFLNRGKPTVVFMLALLHHLCISHNVPFEYIFNLLLVIEAEYVIVEFVPKSDPMVKKLLANREDVYPWYTQSAFESEASKHFLLVDRHELPTGKRVLYCLKRHGH